jgi:hypothetical protein
MSVKVKRKNTKAKREFAPGVKVVEVGRVCVDSGRIMIADPSYEIKHEDAVGHVMAEYGKAVAVARSGGGITNNPDLDKQIAEIRTANLTKQITARTENATTYGEGAPVAVVSEAGLGDGIYPVYAAIADCGEWGQRVAALVVDFDLGLQRELLLKMCLEQTSGGVNTGAEETPGFAVGLAEIFAARDGTTAYFTNARLTGGDVAMVGFHLSTDSTDSYSVPLFINGDMIGCDHGATWEQAMAYVSAVLFAKTAEEAAGRYGELHPRFTAEELIRRVRNPNWEAQWESEQEKQAAA